MRYIYLLKIEDLDVYKIGHTKNDVLKRVHQLQTGNPYKIVLIDSYKSKIATKIESVMHRYMNYKKYIPEDDKKLLGEWFKLNSDDVSKFKEECIRIEKNLIATIIV